MKMLGIECEAYTGTYGMTTLPEKPFTCCGILSTVSSLFDPLDVVAPIILEPKLMLQDQCKQGL